MSTGIVQTYLAIALEGLFAIPIPVGNGALTAYLTTMVVGILLGGMMADKVKYQSTIAGTGLAACAVLLFIAGTVNLGTTGTISIVALSGFLGGIIIPSRDLLVRQASPPHAVGRTFGIVTTGFNFGGMIGPLLGGIAVDHHMPIWVFYLSAIFTLVTVFIALAVDRRSAKA
jgi:MFS family permease